MDRSTDQATRSGWQSYDERGRRAHTWGWFPEEYGYLAADGTFASGNFCENCGKWDGPKLKRGELKRMREEVARYNYERVDA